MKPDKYYEKISACRECQILLEAIRVDIFSYLDIPVTLEELAEKTEFNSRNLEFFLKGLLSCNYIKIEDSRYFNTLEGKKFLSRNSESYLGESIIFREEMCRIENIEKLLKGEDTADRVPYDFSKLADVVQKEMYATGRVEDFINVISKLFPDSEKSYKLLDLGGGSGVLAMEFIKKFRNSSANVFEIPEVACLIKKSIRENKMEDFISIMEGDFNTDEIGENYDLIIASGILNFINIPLNCFMDKISQALNKNGYLMVINSLLEEKGVYPKGNILNWLTGYMKGARPAPERKNFYEVMKNLNFTSLSCSNIGVFEAYLYKKGAS